MNQNHYLIGEFSELTNTSKRMIRHFDQLGLLNPASIDVHNGYRYYSREQLKHIDKIKHLQNFGFSLKAIKAMLNESMDFEDFLDLLKDQEVILRNDKDEKTRHLLKLQNFISYIEQHPTKVEEIQLEEFQIERSLVMNNFQIIKEELHALPSITKFFDLVEGSFKPTSNQDYAFVSFDIDNFAVINDVYGYDYGDKVIYTYYQIIHRNFEPLLKGKAENLICRLGGDELGVYLVNEDFETIKDICETCLKEIQNFDCSSFGLDKNFTATCGIALSGGNQAREDIPYHALRHNSSKAMLEAKRNGRNNCRIREF